MDPTNFFTFANKLFLDKKIPKEQSSLSNFSEITDRNINNLIHLFKSLKDDNEQHRLLKTIYEHKLNFPNISVIEQENTCKKINDMLNEVDKKETLIEKICLLNKYGVSSLFIAYGIDDSPSDLIEKPYVINIVKAGVSLSKDYYFDKKYERELNGLNNHRRSILKLLRDKYPLYFKYSDNELTKMCDDIERLEMELAQYILSNVCKRDIESRVNVYKLGEINKQFPDLNLSHSCFLMEEYDLSPYNKDNIDIIFSSNLSKCKQPEMRSSKMLLYSDLDKDIRQEYDNGEYYWHYINKLFRDYNSHTDKRAIVDNYIRWKVINNFSGLICEEIRVEKFKFYGMFLEGQQHEKSDKERAISYLTEILPEYVGKLFCDTYFTKDHHDLMVQLIHFLIITYEHNFKYKCDWIKDNSSLESNLDTSDSIPIINNSLKEALRKTEVLKMDSHQKIGYPNEKDYKHKYDILFDLLKDNNISGMSLFDFEIIFNKWYMKLDKIKYKRSTQDLTTWEMSASQTNAYYNPLKNEIVFPAGILQPPFFIYLSKDQLNGTGIDLYEDDFYGKLLSDRIRISKLNPKFTSLQYITMASNFGSIGAIVGHEISHGFDDQGSKFDSNGKMNTWWSNSVNNAYKKITDKLVAQFDKYNMELNIDNNINLYHINGNLTLGENIADLFGLTIAIDAFITYYNDPDIVYNKSLDEGLIELFVSFGNTWRYIELPEKTKGRINSDVHSPPMFRVIGTLHNIEKYYDVFNIDKNNIDIIHIWNL